MRAYASGSFSRIQSSFGAVKPGQGAVAGEPEQALKAVTSLESRALWRGALVVPEDRGPDHRTVGVETHEPVHLPREADAEDLRRFGSETCEHVLARRQPRLGLLLHPAGCGELTGYSRSAVASTVSRRRVDGDALGGRRPDVDADQRARSSAPWR